MVIPPTVICESYKESATSYVSTRGPRPSTRTRYWTFIYYLCLPFPSPGRQSWLFLFPDSVRPLLSLRVFVLLSCLGRFTRVPSRSSVTSDPFVLCRNSILTAFIKNSVTLLISRKTDWNLCNFIDSTIFCRFKNKVNHLLFSHG